MKSIITITAFLMATIVSNPAFADDTKTEVPKVGAQSITKPNDGYVRAGILTCHVDGGRGLLITSYKDLECDYTRKTDGQDEVIEIYEGTIRKFGLDIGTTSGGVLKWVIFAPNILELDIVGLSGTYVGASVEASAIVGIGANALIGGSNQSVILQPFSIQVQKGFNLALGVTSMNIQKAEEIK